jgi:hypothetical protein
LTSLFLISLASSIRITPAQSVLMIGDSLQLTLTGTLGDQMSSTSAAQPLDGLSTSNPKVATVGQDGLVTAQGREATFITAENIGVSAVTRIDAASNTLRLRLMGTVRLPDGTAGLGASVHIPNSSRATAGVDSAFTLEFEALTEAAFSVVIAFESGGEIQRTMNLISRPLTGWNRLTWAPSCLRLSPHGTFSPRVFGSGVVPIAIASSDLNGDGAPTLPPCTASTHARNPPWPGDGSFAVRVGYAVGFAPLGVALGDLDSDGDADAAVTKASSLHRIGSQQSG